MIVIIIIDPKMAKDFGHGFLSSLHLFAMSVT